MKLYSKILGDGEDWVFLGFLGCGGSIYIYIISFCGWDGDSIAKELKIQPTRAN